MKSFFLHFPSGFVGFPADFVELLIGFMELPANSRGYIEKNYLEIYFLEHFSCHFPSQNIYTKKLFYNIYDFGENEGILN